MPFASFQLLARLKRRHNSSSVAESLSRFLHIEVFKFFYSTSQFYFHFDQQWTTGLEFSLVLNIFYSQVKDWTKIALSINKGAAKYLECSFSRSSVSDTCSRFC